MQKFYVNGLSMNVQMEGGGPPLIFVHGLGLDHSYWRLQTNSFKARYMTIAYDLRGHGTTEPKTCSTLEGHANDLAVLMEQMDVNSAHLVGLSLGSHICKQFIAMYPEKVNRMVLVSTRAKGQSSNTKRILEEQVNKPGKLDIKLALEIGENAYFSSNASEEARSIFYDSCKHNTLASYLEAMEALSAFDHTGILPRITSPTLIISGSEDRLTTVANGEEVNRWIPKSRMTVMNNTGHLCNLENAERFNEEVLQFLTDGGRENNLEQK
jgi:3-oxoadipate enol-lactonase